MKRVFVDANIIVDLLCERYPWFPNVLTGGQPPCEDASVVRKALDSSFTDFEDAMQHFSAMTVEADCIVTRNKKDFSASEIPVYGLDEFLALF